MRLAILSDIHANLPALEAVLGDVEGAAVDELWCLGDVVGYGAQPDECASLVAERCALCLVGNHDLAVLGEIDVDEFAPDAADAARWTRHVLAAEWHEYLATLQPAAAVHGVELYHGSARDPVWDYVLSEEAAWSTLQATQSPLVLVGHSHVPLALALDGDGVAGGVAGAGTTIGLDSTRWLLNPGSVGQPRDGDARAAYLLLELGRTATFRRVSYPIEQTQAEIRERGLPDALAERLAHGF